MAGPAFTPQPPEDANALTRIFVGENYGYYSAKWQKPKSWNWAAFFLGFGWLAYRKMYTYCFAIFGVIAVESICELAFHWPDSIGRAITIAIAATTGSQGNLFYKAHVEKKLGQIAPSGEINDGVRERLRKEGGTSWGIAIGMVAVFVALLFALTFGWMAATGTVPSDK